MRSDLGPRIPILNNASPERLFWTQTATDVTLLTGILRSCNRLLRNGILRSGTQRLHPRMM